MKISLLMGLVFAGISAAACPDLSGTYNCTNAAKKKFKLRIEQSAMEPVRYYFIDLKTPKDRSDVSIADGKVYKIGKTKKTTKAWCEGEVLRVLTKGEDGFMGRVEYDTQIYKQETDVILDREDNSDFPIGPDRAICKL